MRDLIITIDGPSGAGKSTISQQLAQALQYTYVDTGAMYRAVALAAWEQSIPWDDPFKLNILVSQIKLEFRNVNGNKHIFLNGRDVSEEIRSPHISKGASMVSSQPAVRQGLLELQRSLGRQGGAVLEGRDMGTIVFPDADLKFFLDASIEQRAQRRFDQYGPEGNLSLEEIQQTIKERDHADTTRQTAPLRCPPDAIVIDSSRLAIPQVLEQMLDHIHRVQQEQRHKRQIIIGKTGLCSGIEQAVTRIMKRAEWLQPGQHIYLPVPLAHNPQLMEWLAPFGVSLQPHPTPDPDLDQNTSEQNLSVMAIGTHGIESFRLEKLRRRHQEYLDLTCAKVRRIQNLMRRMTREGYFVVLVGDPTHPEVSSAVSYAEPLQSCAVVQQVIDLQQALPSHTERIAVFSQTAYYPQIFEEVIHDLLEKNVAELRIFNTFCDMVQVRQKEALEIVADVECVVVVGGKSSWNTKLLYELCLQFKKTTIHVETASELDPAWFEGYHRIGVISGTSTPDRIVNEVVTQIRRMPEKKP